MASLTWWTWVWVNSGSWWWTGRPGVLEFMGSQRVGHNWATELNWTELKSNYASGKKLKYILNLNDYLFFYKKDTLAKIKPFSFIDFCILGQRKTLLCACSVMSNSVIPWTVDCQVPLSMGLSSQEYWSGLPFSSPGGLSNLGIEPACPALSVRFFTTEPQRELHFVLGVNYFWKGRLKSTLT